MKNDFTKEDFLEDKDVASKSDQAPNANISTVEQQTYTSSGSTIPRLSDYEAGHKKSSKKKLVVIASVVIAILLLVGVAAWYFFVYTAKDDSKSGDDLSAATRFDSARALLEVATPGLKGKVMEVSGYNGVSAVTSSSAVVYSAPVYKPSDKKFNVLPIEAYGAGYLGDSVAASSNFDVLTSFFKDNKFKRVTETKQGEAPVTSFEKGAVVSYAVYESLDVVCAISHVDASSTELASHTSYIGCGEKKQYEKAANDLQPFFEVYVGDSKESTDELVLGGLEKGKGAEGYERATVYIEDPELFKEGEDNMNNSVNTLFYKKPTESTWNYFTTLEANPKLLYCSEYDSSVDAKKAFAGYGCFDEKSQKESSVS